MDVVYNHVCGLDVHKKTVVVTPDEKKIRTTTNGGIIITKNVDVNRWPNKQYES